MTLPLVRRAPLALVAVAPVLAAAFAVLSGPQTPPPAVAIKLLLLAPVVEELFFRGVLQRALLAWAQARDLALFWANAVTALAFGAAHLLYAPPAHAAAVIAPALALGFVYERTRSLAPCIALHALFNAVWLACVTSL